LRGGRKRAYRHPPSPSPDEDFLIVAKAPARKSTEPAKTNRERPEEPQRYQASKEELLEFYKQMLLIRRFEEKAGQLYGLGFIGGFCHLYIGQEAVAVGLQSALDGDKDSVITGYRDHGHMLAYGIDPKVIMAELTGRAAGISKGKGGSMHLFSTEKKFYGGDSDPARQAAQLYKRGESFRIPGIQVDGMDVLACRGAAEEALAWVRAGKGPIILEMKTYRYRGHSMSDPAKYRSREEVQSVRDKSDPIEQVKHELEDMKVTEAELKAIEAEIRKIVNEAADFSEQTPEPDPSELYTDVLVESY